MTRIALVGAGGKMGIRLSRNLSGTRFEIAHIEVSQVGRDRLQAELGVACVGLDDGIAGAEAVILAVPDKLIGDILAELAPRLPAGTAVIMLDAAAAHAGTLPDRPDLTYFVTHPCHPPIFNDETTPEAKADFFGGVSAKQHIVCGLMQGPEAQYALCEEIARAIYAPVMRAHRCSVEAIAILEPAMAETVGATLALALREATDKAVSRGVPQQAAMDFMLGHLTIELAIAFGVFPEGKFSDGALQAIAAARPVIFRDNWLDAVFEPAAILTSVRDIAGSPRAA